MNFLNKATVELKDNYTQLKDHPIFSELHHFAWSQCTAAKEIEGR
jgi:hypothetical protein